MFQQITDRPLPTPPVEANPDPLTLDALIAWMEKQPPEQTYPWFDCRGACLMGLYAAAIGRRQTETVAAIFFGPGMPRCNYAYVCDGGPAGTIGAALARAKALRRQS